MSGKVKMIKQKSVSIGGSDQTHNLTSFRKKFKYSSDLNLLRDWVKSLEDNSKDGKIISTDRKYYKNPHLEKNGGEPLPEELNFFVNFMLEDRRISLDEVRGYSFSVIKPLSSYSDKEIIRNSKEIIIDQCKANVSDRFIFFGDSIELLTYQLIDISKMKAIANLGPSQQIVENIDEQVTCNDVIHLELQGAISTRIRVDNNNFYTRPHRNGFRDGFKFKKTPQKRFIVVFDIIATTEKVQTVLNEKISMLKDIIEEDPESTQAKMIKSYQSELESAEIPEDDEDEGIVIPELVPFPILFEPEPVQRSLGTSMQYVDLLDNI